MLVWLGLVLGIGASVVTILAFVLPLLAQGDESASPPREALIFSVARLVVWTGGAGVRDDGAWTVRSPVSLISSTAIVGGSLAVSGS